MNALAILFDKLKVKNPIVYAIIVALIVMVDTLIREILDANIASDTAEGFLRIFSQIIVLTLGAI